MNTKVANLPTQGFGTCPWLGCLVFVSVIAAGRNVIQAQDRLTKSEVKAADLVRFIIAEEDKIHELSSFYLRMNGKTTRTPAGIEANRRELEQQFSTDYITPDHFGELRPETQWETELAFDQSRLRKLTHWHDELIILNIWDGTRRIAQQKDLIAGEEIYGYTANPDFSWRSELSWLRVGAHSFWWDQVDPAARSQLIGYPNDYELEGRQEYRGCMCDVLFNRQVWRRLFVGVEDGRLRGVTLLDVPDEKRGSLATFRRLAGKTQGEPFTMEDWKGCYRKLSNDEKMNVLLQIKAEAFVFARPQSEYYLEEYTEIEPDFWFPMKQGHVLYERGEKPLVSDRRDFTVVEIKLNEPLGKELFTIEMQDGVQVNDWAHNPPLFYKYKKDRTEKEWNVIVEKHELEQAKRDEQLAKQNRLIGTPVVGFPKSEWLNSEPLSWNALQGKIVVLDFWAIDCGPCYNDLPGMNRLHAKRDELGFVVIGVHLPGSNIDEVRKVVEQHELKYPIFIDTPAAPETRTFGTMQGSLEVCAIPQSVVIDREGNVAGHGTLSEMVIRARELKLLAADAAEKPNDK